MEIIVPVTKYKESYIKAMREFEEEGAQGSYAETDFKSMESDFDAFVTKQREKSEGKNLPEGWVPQTMLWLVDHNEFIGSVSIRHRLSEHLLHLGGHIGYGIRPSKRNLGYGTKILGLALPFALELGIKRVLITCDETNIGSQKIIEANGGVLENKVPNPAGGPDKLRFWIQS